METEGGLGALISLILGIIGVLLYVYGDTTNKLLGQVLFISAASFVLWKVDFSMIRNPLIGYLVSLLAIMLTIGVYALFLSKIPFFEKHPLVFIVTLARVIPSIISAIIRYVFNLPS